MNRFLLILTVSLPALLCSCDEGDIRNEFTATDSTGFSVRLTADAADADTWSSSYHLALAGFNSTDNYASIAKNIDTANGTTALNLTLSGIPGDVTTVELCVLDGLRRRITTIASVNVEGTAPGTTVGFDAGRVDASMFGAIQRDLFTTTCANCHGASNHTAAGLYLTEGRSRESLVGVASEVVDGAVRVVPGDASASILYQALASDISASWHYDHSVEVPSTTTLDMIRSWIDNGAR